MKKNNIKNFVIAIVTVLVVGLIITGSTFAYFQWTTADDQRTNVSVQIEHGQIVMTISPEATSVSGLKPTNNCSANSRYIDALVKVENGTGTIAIPSFKLKVRVDKNGSDPLTKAALSHINYSVVPLTTVVDEYGNIIKGYSGYTCPRGPVAQFDEPLNSSALFDNGTDWSTHLHFESVSMDGSWTHIPKCGDSTFDDRNSSMGTLNGSDCGYLPRQYMLEGYEEYAEEYAKGDTLGITFKAYPGGTTYQYYRVYVWIDEGYTATAVGNVVSDPLQNATIYVTWSEESTIQQVDGVFAPGANYVAGAESVTGTAGLYVEIVGDDGVDFIDWKEFDGDNWIEGTTLTRVQKIEYDYKTYFGLLVLPEGITEINIDSYALNEWDWPESMRIPSTVTSIFMAQNQVRKVTFAPNSRLAVIGSAAFSLSPILSSIEIPASVTSIESDAFNGSTNLNEIKFKGSTSEWNKISKGDLWNCAVPATEVICLNGRVAISDPC